MNPSIFQWKVMRTERLSFCARDSSDWVTYYVNRWCTDSAIMVDANHDQFCWSWHDDAVSFWPRVGHTYLHYEPSDSIRVSNIEESEDDNDGDIWTSIPFQQQRKSQPRSESDSGSEWSEELGDRARRWRWVGRRSVSKWRRRVPSTKRDV